VRLLEVRHERLRQQEMQLPRVTSGRAIRGQGERLLHPEVPSTTTESPESSPRDGSSGRQPTASTAGCGSVNPPMRQPRTEPEILTRRAGRLSPSMGQRSGLGRGQRLLAALCPVRGMLFVYGTVGNNTHSQWSFALFCSGSYATCPCVQNFSGVEVC